MGRIIRTAQAFEDVLEIWRYLAIDQKSPQNADRMLERIEQTLQFFSDRPQIGIPMDHIRPGLRALTVSSYVLFIEPVEGGVRLLRVAHGSRKLEDLL
ncbi:MAG: type II toxin-antitoxin system RelE/ParE family toxin [Planctomycetaceae bacterium]|nr:type II toxin-antitoxin system RelE/ParE family toxin [Planctomycetaceae bacterium]